MSIIPFQSKFDKDFPVVIGNAEYNAECELLKAMDIVIATSGMEETFIKYALDVAYVNKVISLFGTGKSPRLTAKEIEAVRENAIFALRASILRKHLRLPLRRFVLALSVKRPSKSWDRSPTLLINWRELSGTHMSELLVNAKWPTRIKC